MLAQYPSLIVTKLMLPRLRADSVARPALLDMLETGLERRLILVAAAAGSGKTSLLADWSNRHVQQMSWLSLDAGDNDPIRFLSYMVAAVQMRHPHVGRELLAALQSPQPPPIQFALQSFVNQMAALTEKFILILDDYHVIGNRDIHNTLAYLLDHGPPQLTLGLLTRTDPPLALARLRARNDLLELRAAQLRFSLDETRYFLNETMGLELTDDVIYALDTRTEGWITGLQLAAIAMQASHSDRAGFVRSFTGSHRFVLDYLIEEVLSQQLPAVRDFLLQTAFLRRFNGALCDAVVGTNDGQAMIEYLEKNNLFVIPLDGARYWYRYHHLFADLLQARLQAEHPIQIAPLRVRAAQWLSANDLAEEAITYALEARDYAYAAQLITGPAMSVMARGEVTTLLEWYQTFPRDFVHRQPRLCLQFGMAFALNGRWDDAESLLNAVEQGQNHDQLSERLLLAYLVATYRQDAGRLAAIAQEASATVQRDRVSKLTLGLVISLGGDWRGACEWLAEAQEASERAGDWTMALTTLFHQCRLRVFAGDLHLAHELGRQALGRIYDIGDSVLPLSSLVYGALGRVFIEWGMFAEAERQLAQAIRIAELTGLMTGVVSSATMMLAEIHQAAGDTESAGATAQTAIDYAERYDPPNEVEMLKTYQARIWLTQGNVPAAIAWMRATDAHSQTVSLFYPPNIQAVTRARVLLTQRKTDEAIHLLTRLTGEGDSLLKVEILAILALAKQAQGDRVHALLALEQALMYAESEKRSRVFAELGHPIVRLLAGYCEAHPKNSFARELLATLPTQQGMPSAYESLNKREREILWLIVGGRSNEEIAQDLTLALSTVKWYINALYSKLRVKTRSQAIARAHELKIFAD